jgi:type I restriction enzyme, R subunit
MTFIGRFRASHAIFIEYFDAYLIGLTATPDNRTYGFFKKNIVSEYSHEQAVADGVNVGNEIYVIETEKSKHGGKLVAAQQIEKRERLTCRRRWETQDEDEVYSAKQLDGDIVNPDQILTVIRTFKEKLPEIFPGRNEVPTTLIFAKSDSHADDIIQTDLPPRNWVIMKESSPLHFEHGGRYEEAIYGRADHQHSEGTGRWLSG